ncbi:MAG: ribonuclease [Nitrosomonadales bacterium]|nr:ribonuclease [Nitrosomonadales bacterium]
MKFTHTLSRRPLFWFLFPSEFFLSHCICPRSLLRPRSPYRRPYPAYRSPARPNWFLFPAFLFVVAIASTAFAVDADVLFRSQLAPIVVSGLPPEARDTLRLIKQGGPFPYPRDGVVFGNYEKRLPLQPRGYYREYTVKTPGARNRGARRIVCGVPVECYYSSDHYRTFQRIKE